MKRNRQRFYCEQCKQTRLAKITYTQTKCIATCSKGHVTEQDRMFK